MCPWESLIPCLLPPGHRGNYGREFKYSADVTTCEAVWLSIPPVLWPLSTAGSPGGASHWSAPLFFLQKRENPQSRWESWDCSFFFFFFYLSPDGLEVMTQSKYSLAARESSTLFTSLVKLPSTCLLLKASARPPVSDLSMYTGTQCKRRPIRAPICPTAWKKHCQSKCDLRPPVQFSSGNFSFPPRCQYLAAPWFVRRSLARHFLW